MSSNENGFSEVSFDTVDRVKKNIWTLKRGDEQVYRILPPLGSGGKFAVMHKIHFGPKGRSKKDPTLLVHRPFKCIEEYDFTTNSILSPCPMCEKVKQTKEYRDTRQVELKKDGKSEDEIKTLLAPINEFLFAFNLDKKYHLNVKRDDGSFGKLKLPKSTYSSLMNALKDLEKKKKVNALNKESGAWVVLERLSNNGLNPPDTVKFLETEVRLEDGSSASVIKKAPLTEDDYQKAKELCFDLSDSGATTLTLDQIKLIVESPNDPDAIDTIFNMTQNNTKSATNGQWSEGKSKSGLSEDFSVVHNNVPHTVLNMDKSRSEGNTSSGMTADEFKRKFSTPTR